MQQFSPKLIFCLAILSLLTVGCEFSTDKIHFKEIDKPEDPSFVVISISGLPDDSNVLWEQTEITVTLEHPKLPILEYSMMIDSNLVYPSADHQNRFIIDPQHWEQGIHTLTARVITGTGNNSLADKVSVNGWIFQRDIELLFLENALGVATISHKLTDEGFLEISWDAYPVEGIEKYLLIVTDYMLGGMSDPIDINDLSKKSYVDSSYLGGRVIYQVNTYIKGKTKPILGKPYEVDFGYDPMFSCYQVQGDSLKVSWGASPFPARYRIGWEGDSIMVDTFQINHHTFPIPPYDYTQKRFAVRVSPRYGVTDIEIERLYFSGNCH